MAKAAMPMALFFALCATQAASLADAAQMLGDEACSAPDLGYSLLQTHASVLRHRPDHSLALSAVKRRGDRRSEVCDPAADNECKSMCRWLKLAKEDAEPDATTPCKLVEWTMRTCGYKPTSERSESDPIDCVVDNVRANVREAEVENYARRLEECLGDLPKATASQYELLVQLLTRKLGDFGAEAALKANATALATQLQSTSARAQRALEVHGGEDQVIRVLETVLAAAEQLPGHYLVDDIHTARRYLERLVPIPPVRRELRRAIREGKAATDPSRIEAQPARQFGGLWPLIVRLNVSVHDAEALKLGDPLPEAKVLLKKLRGVRQHLLAFRATMFDGNVSLGTKTNMNTAASQLESNMNWANDTGFTRGVPRSEWLVDNLERSIDVLHALRNTTDFGKAVLNGSVRTGLASLDRSVTAINSSLSLAFSIGIGGPALTRDAQYTLDELEYLREARGALLGAEHNAESVLDERRGKLSDDKEEEAVDELRDAMVWARELQLPVSVARADLAELARVEKAKASMAEALALGEASAKAKVGEQNAIKGLSDAIAKSVSRNVTAGAVDAQKLIDLLRGRLDAKRGLDKAETVGKQALTAGSGYKPAINALKKAMSEAEEEELDELIDMAQTLLDALQAALDNAEKTEKLEREGKDWDGSGEGDVKAKVSDKRATGHAKRHGYRVAELVVPKGGYDDDDDDFDEHIEVLEFAIDEAHRRGEIDPRWEVMIKEIEKKRHAYLLLDKSIEAGRASMKAKESVESSIEMLTTALAMSREAGLKLSVHHATQLLAVLARVEPVKLEFQAALLQANISCEVQSHMGSALGRLEAAVQGYEELDLRDGLSSARSLVRRLSALKSAHSALKAAVVQGEAALKHRTGEESAFESLEAALKDAVAVGLDRDMPVALDLHEELAHMNEEQQDLADALSPLD